MSQVVADRYELQREVGRGGMGAVWLAVDRILRRQVALKRVGLVPGREEVDGSRVEREARVAAMVNHPNVVGVLDLVEHDGEHWLVMEYVESETLAQRIRRDGPLEPDELAPILRQATAALATAHDAGVIHRDVKPSNILLALDGIVKLGDFGIARAANEQTLTMTGVVTGSPGYMAPEVANGHTATSAADVWSLGTTAFHALNGKAPYHSTSEELLTTLYRVVHEEPPRTDRAGWLEPLLRATMHRDPESRWTAREVLAFLEQGPAALPALPAPLTDREPEPEVTTVMPAAPAPAHDPQPVHPRRRRALVPAAGVAALLVLLGVGLWAAERDNGGPTPPATASGDPTSDVTVTDETFEPTARDMEAFVRDYLATVASSPAEAYALLTPAFQQESNDFQGYLGWWDGLRNARVTSIEADPETLQVSYDVRYAWAEGKDAGKLDHDSTTLVLSFDEQTGEYRIADEL